MALHLTIALRPAQGRGVGDGLFRILLSNSGPTDLAVQMQGQDPAGGLQYTFEPALLVVPAGQERYVHLRVHPRTPLSSEEPQVYSFTVTARPTDFPELACQVQGEWKLVAPFFELELRPAHTSGVVEGTYTVYAVNYSLEELTLDLRAADAHEACLYTFQPLQIVVPAGQGGPAQLKVRARAPLPGGEPVLHTFAVTARPREAPQVVRQVQGEWEQALPSLDLVLRPLQPGGEAEGVFHLEVRNADSVDLTVSLDASDPSGACLYTLTPPLVVVPAGRERPVQVRVQPRAALRTAETQRHPFTITARPAEAPGMMRQAQGEWVQFPTRRPAGRTWGPLLAIGWGWSAAWVGGMNLAAFLFAFYGTALRDALTGSGQPVHLLPSVLLDLLVGVLGGLVTTLAVWWAEPTLHWPLALRILFGWAVCLPLGGGAASLTLQELPADVRLAALAMAAYGVAVGLAGGAVTGLTLRRALSRARPLVMALGWAIAWGLGEGLLSLFGADLYNLLSPVFAGLPDPDYAVYLAALAILGAIVGLGGGVVTVGEIRRARRRVLA